jgi:hypothetical protein
MNIKIIGFGIVTLGLLAGTAIWAITQRQTPAATVTPVASVAVIEDDDGDVEAIISLADLPAAVRTALAGIIADTAVTQVAKEEEDGVTTYDVEYIKDGQQWAVEFSATGTVLENEPDDEDGDNE